MNGSHIKLEDVLDSKSILKIKEFSAKQHFPTVKEFLMEKVFVGNNSIEEKAGSENFPQKVESTKLDK